MFVSALKDSNVQIDRMCFVTELLDGGPNVVPRQLGPPPNEKASLIEDARPVPFLLSASYLSMWTFPNILICAVILPCTVRTRGDCVLMGCL